jgi:hypothetical protein
MKRFVDRRPQVVIMFEHARLIFGFRRIIQEIAATYEKVTSHLASALAQNAAAKGNLPPVSHTMLDLLIILIPHLPAAPAKALFNAASTGNLIENSDAAIQKKSYRILTRLIESNKANALQGEGFDEFVQKLVDVSASIGPGAQRVGRIAARAFVHALCRLITLVDTFKGPDVAVDHARSHPSQYPAPSDPYFGHRGRPRDQGGQRKGP